jgi:hypothetical protein
MAMPHNLLEPTVRSIATGSGLGSGSAMTSRERYYDYHSTVIFTGQPVSNWPSQSNHCTMGKNFTNLEVSSIYYVRTYIYTRFEVLCVYRCFWLALVCRLCRKSSRVGKSACTSSSKTSTRSDWCPLLGPTALGRAS